MARDSLLGEEIIWSGGPKEPTVPPTFKVVAIVSATMSVVAIAFALVVSIGLRHPPGDLVLFAGWCATVALGSWRVPLWFRSQVRYVVTEKRVVWQRGRLRRSIERDAISYAIVRWHPRLSGVGDLVLERAVPTGALRRTLTVTLADVEAPDRLWAIVRGLTPSAPLGDGRRPLAQRLDDGERVLWSAFPRASRWTARRVATAIGATLLALSAALVVGRVAPVLAKIFRVHALPSVLSYVLTFAVALVVILLVAVAAWIGYAALLRPWRLARSTRYFVTDRRVLIRRGAEELHLDRQRIAYVITTKRKDGDPMRDLFLVLDGPQARAFSPSGAFGEGNEARLRPMFAAIEDADTASDILHVSRISLTNEVREAA